MARKPFVVIQLYLLIFSVVSAQFLQGQAAADLARSTGSPSSIYYGSDLEQVDSRSGNLRITLPLLHLPGRGLDMDVVLSYNSKIWQSQFSRTDPALAGSVVTALDLDNGFLSLPSAGAYQAPGWKLGDPRMGSLGGTSSNECLQSPPNSDTCALQVGHATWIQNDGTRIGLVTAFDGTTFTPPKGEMASFDGTFALYGPKGLVYKEGLTANATPGSQTLTDTNGNTISCSIGAQGSLTYCVDTVGRNVTFQNDSSSGLPLSFSYLDSAAIQRQVFFHYGQFLLKYPFTSGNAVCNVGVAGPTTTHLLTGVTLANGLGYQFQYLTNPDGSTTGEVSKIILPTGGYIRYVYSSAPVSSDAGLAGCGDGVSFGYIGQDRVIAQRFVSPDGSSTSEQQWAYSFGNGPTQIVDGKASQIFRTTDPLGNSKVDAFESGVPLPHHTDYIDSTGKILKTTKRIIEQGQLNSSALAGSIEAADGYWYANAFNNPRYSSITTILPDTNQQSQTTFSYGAFNNVIEKDQTDWGMGAPGPVLRKSTFTYWHDSNLAYAGDTVHILDRVKDATVCDSGNTFCSQTTTSYDTTPVAATTNVAQHDYDNYSSANTLRGNPTQVSRSLNTTGSPIVIANYYDDAGNLLQVTDPKLNNTYFSFDDNFAGGNPARPTAAYVTKITKPVTGTVNHVERFQYYLNSGLVAASCGENFPPATACQAGLAPPLSDYKSFSYDLINRPATTTFGDGGQTTLTYNETALPISIGSSTQIDSTRAITRNTLYDGLGRISQTQLTSDPAGTTYELTTYDEVGRKSRVYNPTRCNPPNVNCGEGTWGYTSFGYDGLGRAIIVTSQDGGIISSRFYGNAITATDQAGRQRRTISDGLGRLIEVDEPGDSQAPASNVPDAGATVTIGGQGEQSTVIDLPPPPPCSPSGICGDALTAGSGGTETIYDSGNVSIIANGHVNQATYGQFDSFKTVAANLAAAINGDSAAAVDATVSGASILLTPRTSATPVYFGLSCQPTTWRTTQFQAPSFVPACSGAATVFGGHTYITQYTYDALGNLLCVEQHGNTVGSGCSAPASSDANSPWRIRRFSYDSLSRLISSSNPEANTVLLPDSTLVRVNTTYRYDDNGNLISKTAPAPNQPGSTQTITTNYRYDALNRLQYESFSDGTYRGGFMYDEKGTTQFGNTVRNGIGRLTSSWEAWGGQGFSYDEMGRPLTVRRVVEHAADFLYTYNIDGSVTSLQYPSGRVVNYAYDAAGHALSATDSNGTRYVSNATYWPNGAEFQRSMPNIYFSTSLNKRLQVSALYSDNGVVSNYYLNKTYDYGAQNNGNVLSIANNKDPNRTQTFTYDNLNRLISAQNAGTDCSEVLLDGHTKYWGNSYGYDPWGNLINKTITKCGAEHLQAQALASNQLADYGYDSAGNMTQDLTSGMQYHYDAGNMLKTVGSITYWYDNDGQRYIKWNNGVPVKSYFYGSDGEILAEGSGGSTLTAEYIFFNGKRLARVDLPGNAVHYYLSDALNTTSMEVNSAGVIENESDYYPWGGELKFTVNDPGNPYKFTGKERDTETGLDYFGARYYSNGLGRFSTPDWSSTPVPVPYADITDPQSLNQYSYVRNIPTSDVDSDGHDGCCKTLPEPTEADWKLIDQAGRGGIEISLSAMAAGAALVFGPVMIKPDILPGGTVGQSDSDEQAQIQQASQERAAQNGGVDPQAEPEPAAASAAPPMKGNGRGGKQDRLNQLGNDDKQSSSDRGWIKQDQNAINRGQRTTVRVPPGKQMAHARGREAAKGYNHKTSPSSLQNIRNHRTQHKYDGHGKKNKERN